MITMTMLANIHGCNDVKLHKLHLKLQVVARQTHEIGIGV